MYLNYPQRCPSWPRYIDSITACHIIPLLFLYTSRPTKFGLGHVTCFWTWTLANVVWAEVLNVFGQLALPSWTAIHREKNSSRCRWAKEDERHRMQTWTWPVLFLIRDWKSVIWRAKWMHHSVAFYIGGLSILGFWYLQGMGMWSWNHSPMDT